MSVEEGRQAGTSLDPYIAASCLNWKALDYTPRLSGLLHRESSKTEDVLIHA
jgi:hypothetical protein